VRDSPVFPPALKVLPFIYFIITSKQILRKINEKLYNSFYSTLKKNKKSNGTFYQFNPNVGYSYQW